MKHLLIAFVITIGLAFAPLAEAMCSDPHCAQELTKVEKKETTSKALHVCACHHHCTPGIQLPSASISTAWAAKQVRIITPNSHRTSAIVSPLLEPPSHA